MTKSLLSLPILALSLGLSACQPSDTDQAPADGTGATASEQAVQYEPAYPSEVSDEGLSAADSAQQETTHSHGGDTHSHDEGEEHSHDDGGHEHEEEGEHDGHEH